MAHTTAAKRYARALFELSREHDAVEAVHADLDSLASLAEADAEWRDFVESPFGALEKREKLLESVLTGRVHPLTSRFLAFIDRRRRIELLPAIIIQWKALHDEAHGLLRARVVSAIPLAESQRGALLERLGRRFNRKVVLTSETDASLIGGIRVFIGDHILDYSIQSQLEQLRKKLIYA